MERTVDSIWWMSFFALWFSMLNLFMLVAVANYLVRLLNRDRDDRA